MRTANANARQANQLISSLVLGGVRDAVVSPGSRNTPVVLALHALAASDPEFRLYTVHDERSAAFFALGIARVRRSPVILSCTSGSAGAHYLPAILEASQTGLPIVAITADRPVELQDCDAPQTVNQARLFGVHVRRFFDLGEPSAEVEPGWLSGIAAQVLDAARGARPGPVHLNMPFREPLWEADVNGLGLVETSRVARVVRGVARLEEETLDALAERLGGIDRGVVLCGPMEGAESDRFRAADLAEILGWPLLADASSGQRLTGQGSPTLVTTADALLRSPEVADRLRPDLVLRFGKSPTSKACSRWLRDLAKTVLLVDATGRWMDPEHRLETLLVADPATLIQELCSRLSPRKSAWLGQWQAGERQAREVLAQVAPDTLWSGSLVQTLVTHVGDCQLHVASSMAVRDLDTFAPATGAVQVSANRGTNGIDGTLATLLGQAVASQRPSALLVGDLAFLHDHASLLLARHCETPVVMVVVDNGGGAIFGGLKVADHPAFEAHFLAPHTADLLQLSKAAGVDCREVKDLADLSEGLAEALSTPGVSVLVAHVDRALDEALRARAFAEVARALASSARPSPGVPVSSP